MPEPIHPLKMRILQLLPSLDAGGVERGTVDLAVHLKKTGHFSCVISNGGRLVDTLRAVGVLHISLPVHTKNPFKIILNAFRLVRVIKDYEIEVIHARSRAPAWSALMASKMTGIPLVTTFHGTYNFSKGPLGYFKKLYNSVMVRGHRVISISDFIEDHILFYYLDFLKLTAPLLIHRGVDLKVFCRRAVSITRPAKLKEAWGILPTHQVILVPGRLTRWKGQLVVLRALDALVKQHPSLVAVFIGSDQGRTAYVQEMHTFIKQHHLERHVRFVNHIDDMPAAYLLGHVMVHAATDPEAFGRVIIEAQAMGVPVVASDLGEPGRMIDDGKTGFLHTAGDDVDLALKIRHVLDQDTSTVVQQALEKVQTLYSDQLFFQKNVALYQEVIAAEQSGTHHRPLKKILVIRQGAFGDIVKSTGAFRVLRDNHPDAHITLLIAPAFKDFCLSLGFFDAVMEDTRARSIKGYWDITTQLHTGAFDRIYDLQGSRRSGRYFKLLCWRFGRNSIRWSGKVIGCHYPQPLARKQDMHPYDRFADQLYCAGLDLKGQKELVPDLSLVHHECALEVPEKFVLMIPGSSVNSPQKRWPALFYGEIAHKLEEKGVGVVIVGSALEQPLAEVILKKCPSALNLTGKTSFLDVFSLGQKSLGILGNDTGPLYMACVSGKPTLIPWSNYCKVELTAPRGDHVHLVHEPLLTNLSPARVWMEMQKSLFPHG